MRELSSTCDDPSVSSDDDCTITGGEITDVIAYLADDAQEGRNNLSPASGRVKQYLIERLQAFAVGAAPGGGFEQPFAAGTNLIARIPAADPKVSETIVLGAHYDHLGIDGAAVYNGATDNAAGVAAVLAVGRALANLPTPPPRPIILALWDAEEDGLLGSTAYTASPAVALADTVAYVNIDIAGSNPVVGWRRETFVIGRDTSDAFPSLLAGVGGDPLALQALGAIFGQGRSDYLPFLGARVPTLFFSDATGGCYHTVADDLGTVHVGKVLRTAWLIFRLVRALADTPARPTFRDQTPPVTFDDAVTLRAALERSLCDATGSGVQATQQATIADWITQLDAIVARGPAAFTDVDLGTVGQIAVNGVSLLASLPCQRN